MKKDKYDPVQNTDKIHRAETLESKNKEGKSEEVFKEQVEIKSPENTEDVDTASIFGML